jgi:predicted transposase YbfD/YdcC
MNGQTSCDARWYLSSLTVDPNAAAHIARSHWGIENQLQWVLDVVFRKDALSISDMEGAAHIGLINRVALVLLKHNPLRDSIGIDILPVLKV